MLHEEYGLSIIRIPNTEIHENTGLASIGMGTPAFTYSNVIGGIGTVGSYWETRMTIKMKDQE